MGETEKTCPSNPSKRNVLCIQCLSTALKASPTILALEVYHSQPAFLIGVSNVSQVKGHGNMLLVPCAWDHPCGIPCKLSHYKATSPVSFTWENFSYIIESILSTHATKTGLLSYKANLSRVMLFCWCQMLFCICVSLSIGLCDCAIVLITCIDHYMWCYSHSKLATNLKQAVNFSFSAATQNWQAVHMDVSNNFHSQLTPQILGFN